MLLIHGEKKNDFTGNIVILNHKQVNSLPEHECLGTRAAQRDTQSIKYRANAQWPQSKPWE